MDTAHDITQRFIEPLCDETRNLFKACRFSPQDRLRLTLDGDGKRFIAELFSLSHDGREVYPSHAAYTWVKRIPERKEIHGRYAAFELAGTDFTVLLISHVWPKDQLILDEDASVLYNYLLQRFIMQTEKSRDRAMYKINKCGWEVNRGMWGRKYQDNAAFPLAGYQTLALDGAYKQEGAALFMEQGTGKTPIVIARINNEARELNESRMYRTIIVCPKNVRANWKNEFIRFSTVQGRVAVLRGGALERVKLLVEAFQENNDGARWVAIVCSYETLIRSWDVLKTISWDLAVADESHFFKAPSTKRWKYMQQLRELSSQRMVLTGTPISNWLLDIYTQLEFLGEGLSGFMSWKNFRSYYGKWEKREHGEVLVGYKNVPLIQERLARLAFMIRKEEAMPNLPEKMYDVIEVEMTPEQTEYYAKLQKQLALEIKADLEAAEAAGRPKQLTVNNILTKLLRLAQITSGFITWDPHYDDDGNIVEDRQVDRLDPNPKIEELVEQLKYKGPNDKTIVWACWVQDIRSIAARLTLEGIKCVTYYGSTPDKEREAIERSFNEDPTVKVLIGNPAAGGTGLNLLGYDYWNEQPLTTNANHVIYYSQNWSMTARSQSEDRAHRRGTRRPVRYTDLTVPGTIDEEIRVRVLQKKKVALAIQDVRDILDRVLKSVPTIGD